jgi:hypothetical protein
MNTKKLVRWAVAIVAQIFVSYAPALAQTPTLVYSDSLAAPGESGNGFRIQYGGAMGTGSLTGNLITVRITAPHGSTISSITDNLSQSYSLATSVDSGSGGWITALYYKAGTVAGVTQITVTYSAAVADWHGAVMEYSNVSTSSPVDATCSNHSTTISCSLTTTAPNDLVVSTMIGLGSTLEWNRLSTITPGGGLFFDAADTQSSDADSEVVQAAAGSITPSFTVTGSSQAFNIIGVAFKAATDGTNPTGMYILHEQHVAIAGSVASFTPYFVSSGNLLVASYDLGPSFVTASIDTCSPSNTWARKTEGTLFPYFFYVPSTGSFSTSLSCTFHNTGSGGNGILVIYDVVGAAAQSFDVLSSGQSQGNGGFVSGTVTPTNGPGIMFAAANDGIGPVTQVGVSGTAGTLFDNTPYTGETDTGQLNNGDAWQHLFYNSASTITYTWMMANSSSYMQTSAIVFIGQQGPPPTVTVTISPTSDSTNAGATLQFTSTVTGSTNTAVTWSTTCGSINSGGLYTAPATASTCTVTATSQANPADSASASVTVDAPPPPPPPPAIVVTISPTSDSMNVNTTLQFTSTVAGSTNTAVTWSTTCGSISSGGLYTAPATASTCTVTATGLANAADSASASVTVRAIRRHH